MFLMQQTARAEIVITHAKAATGTFNPAPLLNRPRPALADR